MDLADAHLRAIERLRAGRPVRRSTSVRALATPSRRSSTLWLARAAGRCRQSSRRADPATHRNSWRRPLARETCWAGRASIPTSRRSSDTRGRGMTAWVDVASARITNEKRHRDLPAAGCAVRDRHGTQPAIPVTSQPAEHRTVDWGVRYFQPRPRAGHHYRWHRPVGRIVVRAARRALEHDVDRMASPLAARRRGDRRASPRCSARFTVCSSRDCGFSRLSSRSAGCSSIADSRGSLPTTRRRVLVTPRDSARCSA